MKSKIVVIFLILLSLNVNSQIFKRHHKDHDTTDLTYTGTFNPYSIEYDTTGSIQFSGYVSTYFSNYSDKTDLNGYSKFPTVSPRNNSFGLNLVQLSSKYQSRDFRGIATIFFGDIANSSWSPTHNLIQEAHIGFRIKGKWWLDAGYFRTHIGLESIQPRENIGLSLATTTYFEPYFLSGVKLTWEKSEKFTFQINAFNSFNTFVDNNKKIGFGTSIFIMPTSKSSLSINSYIGNERPTYIDGDNVLFYNDVIYVFKSNRLTVGLEGNYGLQTKSNLKDSTKTASMYSSIASIKYRLTSRFSSYSRLEQFTDLNQILTGKVLNSKMEQVGLSIYGATVGVEYKPIPNSYFRVEGRYLTSEKKQDIFMFNNKPSNHRYEILIGLGLWF